jgi:hypothetical protein
LDPVNTVLNPAQLARVLFVPLYPQLSILLLAEGCPFLVQGVELVVGVYDLLHQALPVRPLHDIIGKPMYHLAGKVTNICGLEFQNTCV